MTEASVSEFKRTVQSTDNYVEIGNEPAIHTVEEYLITLARTGLGASLTVWERTDAGYTQQARRTYDALGPAKDKYVLLAKADAPYAHLDEFLMRHPMEQQREMHA